MNKNRVYIVHPDTALYAKMFKEEGWEVVDDMTDAMLVLFTGGEDVSPALYDQSKHPKTYVNQSRDDKEIKAYERALELGLPMVGICRGGQLLNVLNSGSMWQDVNGHHGPHIADICGINKTIEVSSDHHQMMRPSLFKDVITLIVAHESTKKECMLGEHVNTRFITKQFPDDDAEALYYTETNCLCFQPHPEYPGYEECKKVFFWFIKNYSFSNEKLTTTKDIIPF